MYQHFIPTSYVANYIIARSMKGSNYYYYIKCIIDNIDCQNEFISKSQVSMNSCWELLHKLQCKQWLGEITRKPKSRTYVTFKNSYEVEPYALSFMNRKHRSYRH